MLNYEWIQTHRKSIGLILLGVLLLLCLQFYHRTREKEMYYKQDGALIAIQRENVSETVSVPLVVEAEQDGERRMYEITLSLSDGQKHQSENRERRGEDIDQLKVSIENLVDDLEQTDDLVITLPSVLGDGTKLTWKRPSTMSDYLLLLLFPLGVAYLYRSEYEREVRMQKEKHNQIKRALPAFNDQVLLLMNSGMIFHDAFFQIAASYQSRSSCDAFGSLLMRIAQESYTSGNSLISLMEASKAEVGMREYSRMVNIIVDNQIKGVGLKEKLESESHLLWESRKASALQKGKEIEMKMTFPLAVLLIVVVMVAGVPAMMSM